MSNYPPGYDRDAHERAMGHDDPEQMEQPYRPLTSEERLVFLVRLGMQAWDSLDWPDTPDWPPKDEAFLKVLTERMRQAVQVWTMEVEER